MCDTGALLRRGVNLDKPFSTQPELAMDTIYERYVMRQHASMVERAVVVGPTIDPIEGIKTAATVCVTAAAVAYTAVRWFFRKYDDPSEIITEYRTFEDECENFDVEDSAMERNVVNDEVNGVERVEGEPPIVIDVGPDAGLNMRLNLEPELHPQVRRRSRRRIARGQFLLVKQAQAHFGTSRLDPAKRTVTQGQIYTYMVREAARLNWTIRDRSCMPVLVALAMLPTRDDIDAKRVVRSSLADERNSDFRYAGDRYPSLRALYRAFGGGQGTY